MLVEYKRSLDLKNNAIFFVNSSLPEHDPLLIFQLEELASAIPEIAEFRIKKFDKKQHKEIPYNDITVEEFLNGKLSKSGTYPRYKKGEDLYDEFKFEVLKDLKDIDWYHATKVSNYKKIKTQGLRPSKDFPPEEQQKRGWTMFNFDLQNAVYLTHDIDRARDIANTLTERYSEDAIILKISGEALNDPTKIVVDEDILRDEYTDEIYPREAQGIPEYIISITSEKIAGLGYKSKILPNFIDPIEVVKVENLETED
jgi:hypothetical protein